MIGWKKGENTEGETDAGWAAAIAKLLRKMLLVWEEFARWCLGVDGAAGGLGHAGYVFFRCVGEMCLFAKEGREVVLCATMGLELDR